MFCKKSFKEKKAIILYKKAYQKRLISKGKVQAYKQGISYEEYLERVNKCLLIK